MQSFSSRIQSALSEIYTENEIRNLKLFILEKLTGFSREKLLADNQIQLTVLQKTEAGKLVERLKNQEPIQYVLGETEFCGLTLKVNPAVLIPRPETEELVEWIVNDYKRNNNVSILDIGTGSGCIAIALKKNMPAARISALDISSDALTVAEKNAEINKTEIQFIQLDMLKMNELNEKFDMIVSNPPYVLEQDKHEMERTVIDFEPPLALFVPDKNPLVFYEKIAGSAKKLLNINGKLYFEIHRNHARNCIKLLAAHGYSDIQLKKDISGNDRMIKCTLPS